MEKLLNVIRDFQGSTEDKIREKGRKMIEKTFEDQKSYGLKLQDKFENLTNADILTTSLPFRADIPQRYRNRIAKYREKIREIIFGVSVELQNQKFKGLDHEIKDASLSKYQERRYVKVRDAQKELYASYDAIRESLNFITELNNKILKKITEETGPKKKDLLFLNAIIVYELTDAIIDLLEDFHLRGKDTLKSINDQVLEELRVQEAHDDDLLKRASNSEGDVEKGVRKSIQARREIREIVKKKWDKIWDQVEALEDNILGAKGHLETLKLIKDNAKGQINILEVIGITQIVKSNINNFQEICAVTNIELAPFTKEDVYGLIGKVEDSKESEN